MLCQRAVYLDKMGAQQQSPRQESPSEPVVKSPPPGKTKVTDTKVTDTKATEKATETKATEKVTETKATDTKVTDTKATEKVTHTKAMAPVVLETNEAFLLPYFRSKGYKARDGVGKRREVLDPVFEAPLFRAPAPNDTRGLADRLQSKVGPVVSSRLWRRGLCAVLYACCHKQAGFV